MKPERREAPRRHGSTLGLRLAAMMLVALVPLGLVALLQVRQSQQTADDTMLAASVGWTLQEGLYDLRLMRSAQTTAQLMANSLVSASDDCSALITTWLRTDARISQAGFVQLNGEMSCSSDGVQRDFSKDPRFRDLTDERLLTVFRDPSWAPDGADGISVSAPVITPEGAFRGFALVFLSDQMLRGVQRRPDRIAEGRIAHDPPLALAAVTNKGELVYASPDLATARRYIGGNLMGNLPLEQREARSLILDDPDGIERVYALVPSDRQLSLLAIWPLPRGSSDFQRYVLPYLSPALMWLTGIGVTLIGAERLVIRHIRRLSGAMRTFALGDRKYPEIRLDNASAELSELADTYGMMTDTIMRDGAELENLLRKNSALLREVHHRTGNSLQLIASFLRMHRRETSDEGIRLVLDDLHNRVMSLSSVHLGLYRMAGGRAIAMDQLMAEVIARIDLLQRHPGPRGGILPELEPLHLSARQAVPLALLMAEIISCFPPAGGEQERVRIRLTALATSGAAGGQSSPARTGLLEISGPVSGRGRLTGTHSGAPAVIGARLIRGFVTQLPGEMAISTEGQRVTASITFGIEEDNDPADEPGETQPGANHPPRA